MASQTVGAGALKVASERSERQVALLTARKGVKRPKKRVLEEDDFVEKVDKIIERDFFPYLDDVRKQINYCDAMDKNGNASLTEIRSVPTEERRHFAKFPGNEDWDDEDWYKNTPGSSTEKPPTQSEIVKKSLEGVSLTKFMTSNTSEDNASFSEIMAEAEKQRRKKLHWVYENTPEDTNALDKTLMPPPLPPSSLESRPLETWKYKVHNAVMYVPEDAPLTAEELQKARDAQPKIQHSATRLSGNPWSNSGTRGSSTPSNSQKNRIDTLWNGGQKVGIDGKQSWDEVSPKVQGFSFVATPSPRPGVDESPLMTWGEVESTPYLIAGESSANFRMNAPSEREQLAISLTETRKANKKKKKAIKAAHDNLANLSVPQSPSFSGLSPAAKRLALNKLGIIRGTDRRLMESYTPARDKKKLESSRTVSPYPSPAPQTPTSATVTKADPLSKSKSKPKASDFF